MPARRPSPTRRCIPGRSHRGATVLETATGVAVVVAILGIAVPSLDRTRFRLDDEAESLTLVVRSAQRLATLRGYDLALTFDVVGNRIRIHHDLDADGAVDDGEQTHDIPLRADVAFGTAGAPPPGDDPAPVTFDVRQGGRPALIFRRDGTASESGFVHLMPRSPVGTPEHAEYARAISVRSQDGAVSCISYRTGRWEPSC